MADLTHLFKSGQKIRYKSEDDFGFLPPKFHEGTVKEVFKDHLILDIPAISDHLWAEEGLNIGNVYPEYNF